jgi:hypothetical protein
MLVMSEHIVNWLRPDEHWERIMAKMLGSRGAARAFIASLSVPGKMATCSPG